ncbi:rRNA maturation RNase YbeY [Acholeplasma granularum]|uniref:rRNA maturation RNase YbeY n=1 Tax=Acholeplasma granularum TaxID=264635 RepID=UPI00046FEB38|nr:rRNA maturation RNase YbeY [Acholeplasma granularum]
MEVNYFNQTKEDTQKFENILDTVFKDIKQTKSMQVIFVDNNEILKINQTYRNINDKTDVLSFPNDDELDDSIGDIFISIEQAYTQANNYHHSIEREIGFLAVHGYLHLIGYDHDTPENEKQMFELQEEILKKVNLTR